MKENWILIPKTFSNLLSQVDLCFFSIEMFLNSSVKMVISGGERKMGELLQKHTKDLRCLSSNRDS